ncbi:AAA family ATPase [Streptomyces ipomoeae]|uniref:AAA family ATPase n=1 Tax=Streptomyces ipomoeae TaxID=103232 RepID=UPI0006624C33|nr:AAA family ATPase [Streptomyces ipomoeae]MDX2693320.1 AAA family ATPase [Streptomyces ipomoeae]MDX2838911.1 AAA family ATPase [Streptomyces ipomoeae]
MVTVRPGTNAPDRWGRPARMDRTGNRLLGRERESEQIDGLLSDPGGPRLVFLRGEHGVGRSAFLHATGERLRTKGIAVYVVDCVPGDGDGDRPLLLALRLVMALEERRSDPEGRRSAAGLVARALSAVDRHDQAAMEALLRAALTRCAPVTVLVDDAQHADPDSLAALSRIDAPGVRLVVSAAWHIAPSAGGTRTNTPAPVYEDTPHQGLNTEGPRASGREGAAGAKGSRAVVLFPLGPRDTTALVARWLQAEADADLARRVGELTRGVPGAVEALLTGWTRRGVIRVADRHAFIPARTTVPVLPADDRFVTALDRLGEPARAVAAALSILGPLGRPALQLTAVWTGLSIDAVIDGVRRLVEAGIIDELPGPDRTMVRGWTFRLPLAAHTVRERLSPVERSRLSATAVEVLWKNADSQHAGTAIPPAPGLLDETNALTYRADRIADAGSLVDRERAVAELTAAAQQIRPGTDDGRVLRWLRAARDLTEHADARDLVLQRYGTAAYLACDYPTAQAAAESLLRDPGPTLSDLDLQEAACLVVAVTANQRDWPTMSRLATTHWWNGLPIPALAKVTGQALALCHLSRWRETAELLERTETVWNTSPRARAAPGRFRAMADLAMGRPESYRRELAMHDAPELPPGKVYSLPGGMFDTLLTGYDLNAAETLLETAGLTVHMLPPLSRFLFDHLTGRWDQALESARRLLANDEVQSTPVSDSSPLPARTTAILLARGRITSALQLVEGVRGPGGSPPQCALHASEAEVLMALGDLGGAEKTLRSALTTAQAHDQVYGTDELWALLAEVTAGAGHTAEAMACLHHLERIAPRTGTDRSRLRHLLASARILRQEAPDTARHNLREAVDLARTRGLPFETATTLVAAATTGAVPATLLHEAYELFGTTGATLWRFHTRTALREAGLTVPGRKQTTAENDHLLATLLAEQLTTRQMATVLRLTEDAVARRLSRLFARTGKRSRTELVTAVLTDSL